MKTNILKLILISSLILSLFAGVRNKPPTAHAQEPARLAIVIDDFGEDRHGVAEMLEIDAPLTIAVMPFCEYSTSDAETAHANGHEVILHMPMQNQSLTTPANYYGPVLIKNEFTPAEAKETLKKSIASIPHCKGVNIHMGTGVSQNESLMTAIMEEVKQQGLYFLDSKTIENSVCPQVAERVGNKFYVRDVFLEPSGRPSYNTAVESLLQAGELAKQTGKAIAIGHVGPVGDVQTAQAIKNTLETLKNMGILVVPLSEL